MVCVLKRKPEFEFLKEFLKNSTANRQSASKMMCSCEMYSSFLRKFSSQFDKNDRNLHKLIKIQPTLNQIFSKTMNMFFTKIGILRFFDALYRLAVAFFKNSFRNSNSGFSFNTQTISRFGNVRNQFPHRKHSKFHCS